MPPGTSSGNKDFPRPAATRPEGLVLCRRPTPLEDETSVATANAGRSVSPRGRQIRGFPALPHGSSLREYGGNEPSIFYRRWHYGRRAGRNDVRAVRPAIGRGSLLRLRRAGGRVYLRAGRLTPGHPGSDGGKTGIIRSTGCVPRPVPLLRLFQKLWVAAACGVFGACRWSCLFAIGKAFAKPAALPLPPDTRQIGRAGVVPLPPL